MKTATERKIVVVTANGIEFTGRISFKFMIDANLKDVPRKWAWLAKDNDDGCAMVINVFGGEGLVMGGPLQEDGQDDEKFLQDCWDSVPSCTILMTTDSFEWFGKAAPKYGLEFTHVHHDGFLKTS